VTPAELMAKEVPLEAGDSLDFSKTEQCFVEQARMAQGRPGGSRPIVHHFRLEQLGTTHEPAANRRAASGRGNHTLSVSLVTS
jgi:hypothetical protein